MNAQQFYQYIEHPEKLGIHEEVQLRGMLKEYPYFQSAHLLLTKCLKNMDNYTFEKQLKTAAIFASNRAVLYQLLKNKKDIKPSAFGTTSPFTVAADHAAKPTTSNATEPTPAIIEKPKVELEEKQVGNIAEEKIAPIKIIPQPILEKIIENVEEEIAESASLEDLEKEIQIASIEASIFQTTKTEEPTIAVTLEKNIESDEEEDHLKKRREEIAKQYQDFLNKKNALQGSSIKVEPTETKIEKPIIVESSITEEPEPAKVEDVASTPEKEVDYLPKPQGTEHSFSEWLKLNTYQAGLENKTGNISNEDTPLIEENTLIESTPINESKTTINIDEILDKFIEQNPTISRPKAEFFNPIKAAQKSLEENDDFITETLAKMHEKQGNYLKAISLYEKLSLKFPDKSEIFAARISDIKKNIN
ncbi:MAG: hypothetical protein HYZ42_17055 [Bacteroidetes bacterium]|nr:hypothetical protein [Bacteroidota bacterium]